MPAPAHVLENIETSKTSARWKKITAKFNQTGGVCSLFSKSVNCRRSKIAEKPNKPSSTAIEFNHRSSTEPKWKMDDLPELPFELILSHLSLKDRLTARTVSRSWRNRFDFKWKSLCYSQRPVGFIIGKSRWVSGTFARNFISSPRFEPFANTFGQTILSDLKHLRLCDLTKEGQIDLTAFAQVLHSFGQLEELDIIRFDCSSEEELELNLPTLQCIQLKGFYEFGKLTLNAPKLKKIVFSSFFDLMTLEIVHGDSVERLITNKLKMIPVKKLKNLKYLYHTYDSEIDATLLSSLKRLEEFHLDCGHFVSKVFEQKQRYGRVNLKVFLWGLLLNGPEDPAIVRLSRFGEEKFVCLAENSWKLADELPLCTSLSYAEIEHATTELEVNLWRRFTDLDQLRVNRPVNDIQRFFDFLKNFDNIVKLNFWCDQQELFDRLPEHSALQTLAIFYGPPSDLRFLSRLKNLLHLHLGGSIDAETIRKVLEELQFLLKFSFGYNHTMVEIGIENDNPKQFDVWVNGNDPAKAADPNAAVQLIKEQTND